MGMQGAKGQAQRRHASSLLAFDGLLTPLQMASIAAMGSLQALQLWTPLEECESPLLLSKEPIARGPIKMLAVHLKHERSSPRAVINMSSTTGYGPFCLLTTLLAK